MVIQKQMKGEEVVKYVVWFEYYRLIDLDPSWAGISVEPGETLDSVISQITIELDPRVTDREAVKIIEEKITKKYSIEFKGKVYPPEIFNIAKIIYKR